MQESPIFSRTYDLVLWLVPQVNKFPRVHRFGIGERVIRHTLDFQETIIKAGLSKKDRSKLLDEADVQLALLRQHLRLCKDLDIVKLNQYEHVSKIIVEIGRLLGGWKKIAS
ncbi:MAG: diversity-generating retroelement protein Avd [Anaerolineales bacterium]|nr:diversity-generating retroelement protein Avd [Anaerolineales bacterium]